MQMITVIIVTLLSTTTFASDAPVALDAHYHFHAKGEGPLNPERDAKADHLKYKAQNISEALLFIPDGHLYSDSAEGQAANERASQYFANQSNAHGLCSVSLEWRDVASRVRSCLGIANMHGVKLHLMRDHMQTDHKNFALDRPDMAAVMNNLNTTGGAALIHFEGHPLGQKEGIPGFTKKFIDFAAKYPNVQFVIAHSGIQQFTGLNGLKEIGRHYKSHPNLPRNIFADTSAVLSTVSSTENLKTSKDVVRAWRKHPDVVETWREFGMDYVMFGTDQPLRDPRVELRTITENPLLTPDEKKKILRTNGQRFLRIITSPQPEAAIRSNGRSK